MNTSKEDLILQRLEEIEAKLALVHERAERSQNFWHEMQPVMHDAFKVMLHELGDVETGFQLEDLFDLLKTFLRSVKNLTYTLEKLETIINFWNTAEPLMKGTVPKAIAYLDSLEQRGVFRTYEAMLNVRAKVAQTYGPEEIERMADSFVFLIGLLKKLADPKVQNMIDKGVEAFAHVEMDKASPCGPIGLMRALGSPEAKQGLGVMVELTKTLGKLR
ncbi:MAG: hypothetical protein PWQ64_1305 [Desulfomicrobiaceae bacterium]|nr:hypothetical protein [Desulfomicrobiaceae bacterium]